MCFDIKKSYEMNLLCTNVVHNYLNMMQVGFAFGNSKGCLCLYMRENEYADYMLYWV